MFIWVKKFFADKHGKLVLWQWPNLPLIGWGVFLVLAKVLPDGDPQTWASALSSVSLIIWAILEIGWGASYFRRVLGLGIFILTIHSRLF